MKTRNKPATFFAILILMLIGYILYQSTSKTVSVVIQAGHEGRTRGNIGAIGSLYREQDWNIQVADEVAKQLLQWHISVKRVPAVLPTIDTKIAVSIHFDAAKMPCHSGASIGYPNSDSSSFAQRWKTLYSAYYPFKWHKDNFTSNLKNYYGYQHIHAEKFLLLELGEMTCKRQTAWLYPRLKTIAHLVAYAIATELGKKVAKPHT